MSRTRIVGGNYYENIGGNNRVYVKGDYIRNAGGKIVEIGDEGVHYGEPDDMPQIASPNPIEEVTLNIFFDGTQNNKTNTDARLTNSEAYYENSNQKDDSYTNDYSNVARAYESVDSNVENEIAIYIEGIGTTDLEEDADTGVIFGIGKTGVVYKVLKACKLSTKYLRKYKNQSINLKVNVYGFSRGAAAARNFVYVATQPAKVFENTDGIFVLPEGDTDLTNAVKITERDSILDTNGYFAGCLLSESIKPVKIKMNFVGLYDTVASYGLFHENDTSDLKLDAVKNARFVFQMAADHEYRTNFNLTNIDSCGVNGMQMILPGVHSDIGGGYVDNAIENTTLYQSTGSHGKRLCEEFKKLLIEEGWYKDDQLDILIDPVGKYSFSYSLVSNKRKIPIQYSFIPLDKMCYVSGFFGITYDESKFQKYSVKDPFLKDINNSLDFYLNEYIILMKDYKENDRQGNYIEEMKGLSYKNHLGEETLKELKNKYLHWSVNCSRIGLGPRVNQPVSEPKRKRKINDG